MKHGPGTNVEVLLLMVVNLLQRMNSRALEQEASTTWKDTRADGDSD